MDFIDDVSNKVGRIIDSTIDRVMPVIGTLLGVMLCAYGLTFIIASAYNGTINFIEIASEVTVLLLGIVALVFYRKNPMKLIAIYALALGLHRIIRSFSTYSMGSGQGLFSSMIFIVVVIEVIIGVNLVLSGIYYFNGSSRRRGSLIISTTLLLFFAILYTGVIIVSNFGAFEIARVSVLCVLYALFIWMLDSEESRYNSIAGKYVRTLRSVKNVYCIDSDSYITEEAAESLVNRSGKGWEAVDDGGPAESEMRFVLNGRTNDVNVLVQKWKGIEPLFFTVGLDYDGTVINANRFKAESVFRNGNEICIQGMDGVDVSILVKKEVKP